MMRTITCGLVILMVSIGTNVWSQEVKIAARAKHSTKLSAELVITKASGGKLLGVTANGQAVVNQEFAIDDRGKILIAGIESGAPRAVIGGTGDFSNARGEGILVGFDPDFGTGPDHDTFTIAFSLTGASGPPIT